MSSLMYTIRRTDRCKTASLQIVNGEMTVVVPRRFTDQQVERLVNSRQKRVQLTIETQMKVKRKSQCEFVSGGGLKYLGRTYRLRVNRRGEGTTGLRNGRLEVWAVGDEMQVRDSLTTWYLNRAREKFSERLRIYESVVGTGPCQFSLRDMSTKWGSCSANGKIVLNWRLIFAPIRIIDYVIVHELCHLICHDHSRKFWSKVMRVLPDYEIRKDWLKQNGHLLSL
jgi:predicted metal-dependent hydrolase